MGWCSWQHPLPTFWGRSPTSGLAGPAGRHGVEQERASLPGLMGAWGRSVVLKEGPPVACAPHRWGVGRSPPGWASLQAVPWRGEAVGLAGMGTAQHEGGYGTAWTEYGIIWHDMDVVWHSMAMVRHDMA